MKNNQTSITIGWGTALTWLVLVMAAASPTITQAGQGNVNNPQILPPQSKPFGASYAEWAARFWQWELAFPSTANPAADTAPPESAQSGHVWFLASSPNHEIASRKITVPAGTALFFPALSVYENNSACPPPDTFTPEQLLANANGAWDKYASLTSVKIDDVLINGLDNPQATLYRVQTIFTATVASHDNLLSGDCIANGASVPMAAVGAFLMVKPLSVGNHTIQIRGEASPFLIKNVTYDITVAPGK